MTSYTQLTQTERYQIHALTGADCSMADIAGKLGRHPSSFVREDDDRMEARK